MTTSASLVSGLLAGLIAGLGAGPTGSEPTPPVTAPRVDTAEQSGPWDLVLTDVRVGRHQGFDRIVLEFTGEGVPGWRVEPVEEAVVDGSGHRVRLPGEGVLQISVTGTEWPGPDAGYYDGPDRLRDLATPVLTQVYVGGTFEGHTQVLAGLDDAAAPFEVFTLAAPPRLVVDVEHRPATDGRRAS